MNLNTLAAALSNIQKTSVPDPWAGYAPGTKLLSRVELEEKAKQAAIENAQAEKDAAEKTRQFNESLAEDKRAHNLSYSASMNSGGGGGGGSISDAVASRMATASLSEAAKQQYNINLATGQNKRLIKGDAGYAPSQHPLFYAVNSVLNDPLYQSDIITYGADSKTILNNLITGAVNNGTRLTPRQYVDYLRSSKNQSYVNQGDQLAVLFGLDI